LNSYFKVFAVMLATALLVPAGAIAKKPENRPEKPDKADKHGQFSPQSLDDASTDAPEDESGGPGKSQEPTLKLATANVKGAVTANDGAVMTVAIEKASGHAKACKGLELTFDVSQARFHTADNNASGGMDALDFEVGHVVKVRTKLALLKGRKTTCAAAEELALPARAVHNRTTPQVEEDVDEVGDDGAVGDDETDVDDPAVDETGDEVGDVDETDEV